MKGNRLVRRQQFLALAPRQGAGNLHRCSPPNENLRVLLQLLQSTLFEHLELVLDLDGLESGSFAHERHRIGGP